MKSIVKLALVAILSALTLVAQIALFYLPNVELVTLLLILYACIFPLGMSLAITLSFVTLNWLFWGFGDWVFGYYVIWPILIFLAYLLKPYFKENVDRWALFAGAFGFLFGILFTFHHMIFYGIHTGYAYWIRGISFDLIHCFSNYIVVLLLYKPLYKVLLQLKTRLEQTYGHFNKKR